MKLRAPHASPIFAIGNRHYRSPSAPFSPALSQSLAAPLPVGWPRVSLVGAGAKRQPALGARNRGRNEEAFDRGGKVGPETRPKKRKFYSLK